MAELPADLAAAVNDQAEARVAMSIQGYAKYLTPEAVDTLQLPSRGYRRALAASTSSRSNNLVASTR